MIRFLTCLVSALVLVGCASTTEVSELDRLQDELTVVEKKLATVRRPEGAPVGILSREQLDLMRQRQTLRKEIEQLKEQGVSNN